MLDPQLRKRTTADDSGQSNTNDDIDSMQHARPGRSIAPASGVRVRMANQSHRAPAPGPADLSRDPPSDWTTTILTLLLLTCVALIVYLYGVAYLDEDSQHIFWAVSLMILSAVFWTWFILNRSANKRRQAKAKIAQEKERLAKKYSSSSSSSSSAASSRNRSSRRRQPARSSSSSSSSPSFTADNVQLR